MSKEKGDFLDDMLERQEHQYDPECYTSGKIHSSVETRETPTLIESKGNPTLAAILLFIQAGIFAFIYFFAILPNSKNFLESSDFIALSVIFVLSIVFAIFFGIRFFQQGKKKRVQKSQYHNEEVIGRNLYGNRLSQRNCSACGREHDTDYPKCPYCNHIYTNK